MSRCFPYPLPSDGARGEAVSRLIKLQKETVNPVSQHIKEKKVKKDRRKDGKERKAMYCEGKCQQNFLSKGRDEESEKSGVTEEHEQSVCYLSDGAHATNKRKRNQAATNGSKTRNIIRIRLPLQKQKESTFSQGGLGQQSSSIGSFSQQKDVICLPGQEEYCSVKSNRGIAVEQPTSRVEKAPYALDSERVETFPCSSSSSKSVTVLPNENRTVVSIFKALVEDWVPPSLQFDLEDWLVRTQRPERLGSKTFDNECCSGISTSLPSARILSDADIYALPYTIPF